MKEGKIGGLITRMPDDWHRMITHPDKCAWVKFLKRTLVATEPIDISDIRKYPKAEEITLHLEADKPIARKQLKHRLALLQKRSLDSRAMRIIDERIIHNGGQDWYTHGVLAPGGSAYGSHDMLLYFAYAPHGAGDLLHIGLILALGPASSKLIVENEFQRAINNTTVTLFP